MRRRSLLMAIENLGLGARRDRISHVLITCCTGLSAPGLDLEIIERCRLPSSIERTIIVSWAAMPPSNALKLAANRSLGTLAQVLVVNLELCTLASSETPDLEKILSFLLWGDGCAASLVTAEEQGLGA